VGSFPQADVPLTPPLPEVAFVGRSNVGKSSLLNALLGRRIAKVSATPGKTRLLNVYLVPTLSLHYLDLPGYGYARASHSERAALQRIVTSALERPRLAGVVWLLDLRHEPSADDRRMQDLLIGRGVPVLVALTKADKLPRGRRLAREREMAAALGVEPDHVVVTSVRSPDGVVALREALVEMAGKLRA
jgi:GTP-binding protein